MRQTIHGGQSFSAIPTGIRESDRPQTAYTKEHPETSSTWLCVPCCYVLGINPFEKAKKTVKKVGVKDDRAKIVHYEERKGVPGLSDLCIQVSRDEERRVSKTDASAHRKLHRRCREIGRYWRHQHGQSLQDYLEKPKIVRTEATKLQD